MCEGRPLQDPSLACGTQGYESEKSKMKVYVAGTMREVQRARTVIHAIKALLPVIDITFDWTAADGGMSPAVLANLCRRGVEKADVLVALVPSEGGTGIWVEVGMAIARPIPVLYVGDRSRTVFSAASCVFSVAGDEGVPGFLMGFVAGYSYHGVLVTKEQS